MRHNFTIHTMFCCVLQFYDQFAEFVVDLDVKFYTAKSVALLLDVVTMLLVNHWSWLVMNSSMLPLLNVSICVWLLLLTLDALLIN